MYRKCNGAKSNVQEDKRFKEKPDAKWNKGSGGLRARSHSAKVPTCKKELKKNLCMKKTINSRKLKVM